MIIAKPLRARVESGNPVEGLKKEDFKLLKDGKAQNIAIFEFPEAGGCHPGPRFGPKLIASVAKAPAAPKAAAPKAPAAITPSKTGELRYRDRRLIVFLFLCRRLPPQGSDSRAEHWKFLQEKMTPSDVVAILTFSTDLKVQQDFTDDRDRLAEVMQGFSIGEGPPSALAGEADTADANTGEDTQGGFHSR